MPGLKKTGRKRTGLLNDAAQVALLSFEPNLSKAVLRAAPGLFSGLTAMPRPPRLHLVNGTFACRVWTSTAQLQARPDATAAVSPP